MADAGEMTDKRVEILNKKYAIEVSRLNIKMGELEIRKLEKEEELEHIDIKMKEVEKLIKEKKEELGGING